MQLDELLLVVRELLIMFLLSSVEDTLGHRAKVLATEIKAASALASPQGSFSMPTRIRGRVTQEIGELAGISNKVITGGTSDLPSDTTRKCLALLTFLPLCHQSKSSARASPLSAV